MCGRRLDALMRTVRVLVIDDSLTIRAILESILGRQADFEIVGMASDVEEAKQYLKEHQPDVITLDLALPGIDGMAFLEELAGGPHAPVVVVSSSTQDKSEKAIAAVKSGAVACFDKARLVNDAARFVKVLRRAVESHNKVAA
jgi:two-component system chemotaxis response regulator CheB